jgi:hypothetical protein
MHGNILDDETDARVSELVARFIPALAKHETSKEEQIVTSFMESYSFSWYFVLGTEIHGPDRIFHGKCS